MKIVVSANGNIRHLAGQDFLVGQGIYTKRRASHVEPVSPGLRLAFKIFRKLFTDTGWVAGWTRAWKVQWQIDLSPSGGPIMRSFADRSEAIAAEIKWLEKNNFPTAK